jgi:hypothetical protein
MKNLNNYIKENRFRLSENDKSILIDLDSEYNRIILGIKSVWDYLK